MEMYHFKTEWPVKATVERVWQTVIDAERWPTWGKGFKSVEVRGPDTRLSPGAMADMEVRGALPYTLRFTFHVHVFEPPHILALQSEGDIVGEGRWQLEPTEEGSRATYYWDVGLTSRVLDALGRIPLFKQLMAWNHDRVMDDAYRGFRAEVERRSRS